MSNFFARSKISILIPNKDHAELLRPCVNSILDQTTYKNYEIIIIENNSTEPETFEYYDTLKDTEKVRVITYPEKGFNYHKIMNFAVANSDAEYILQLNNDMHLLTPNWLQLMLKVAKKKGTGAVGAALFYPDLNIQHLGGTLFMKDGELVCEHLHHLTPKAALEKTEHMRRALPVAWLTGACILVSKVLYERVGGMDETYEQTYGDVDLCMKIRALELHNMLEPRAQLVHYESRSRFTGGDTVQPAPSDEEARRMLAEKEYFLSKWQNAVRQTS